MRSKSDHSARVQYCTVQLVPSIFGHWNTKIGVRMSAEVLLMFRHNTQAAHGPLWTVVSGEGLGVVVC